MAFNTYVDIDVADRDKVLDLFKHVPAKLTDDKKHKTGVYFHNVPTDHLNGTCAIDYKQADEFMYTDSLSTCLKLRREATRNTRDNLIFKCIKAEVELEKHNATHSLHIKKINKEIK